MAADAGSCRPLGGGRWEGRGIVRPSRQSPRFSESHANSYNPPSPGRNTALIAALGSPPLVPGRVAAASLLALLLLAGLAPAAPAQPEGARVDFVDADRLPLPPGSQALGSAAAVLVHVRDPAAAGQATVEATVFSPREPAGERVTLARDRDPAAGDVDFFGAVGLEGKAAADDGLVAVSAGDELAVLYGSTWTVRTAPHALSWNRTADAALALSPDLAGAPGRALVTVTDGGADVAGAATVGVHVASATDPLGFTLQLARDAGGAGSPAAPTFRGQFTFRRDGTPGEAPLLVSPGDAVTVRYLDLDAAGRTAERTAAATWRPAADGVLSFADAALRSPAASFVGSATRPLLRYEDADLAGASGVDAVVRAASAGATSDGVRVRLTAVAPGEFAGSFPLALAEPAATGQLLVGADGDTLLATVRDPQGADGLAHDRTASAQWIPGHASTLRFRDSAYAGTPTGLDANGRAYLELEDADLAGAGWANATATSGRDPLGLRVTLREAGGAPGRFRGCFDFQAVPGGLGTVQAAGSACGADAPAATSSGRLLVRAGDPVRASAVDARSDHGPNATVAAAGPALAGAPASPGTPAGRIEFKACRSDCSTASPALVSAGALSGAGVAGGVVLEVHDAAYNLDDASVESFSVEVGSLSAPNAWNATAEFASGQGLPVTVTETAADSGVFRGSFTLSTAPSATALLVGAGGTSDDAVVARYGYAANPANAPAQDPGTPPSCGGPPGSALACAPANDLVGLGLVQAAVPWHRSATASVRFLDPLHPAEPAAQLSGLGPAMAQVRGADGAEDRTASPDAIVARVRSDSDLHGIQVTLTERRAHTTDAWAAAAGADGFVGAWSFTDGPSDEAADRLKVASGDTVSVEYADPQDASGLPAGAIASLRWFPSATGTLDMDQELYRGLAGAQVTVADADLDRDKSTADQAQVFVQALDGGPGADGVLLNLTETGKSSGVFAATLPFQDPPVPGDGAIGPGDGGRVRLTYSDALDGHGGPAVAAREVRWFKDAHGGLLALAPLAGRSGPANVTLSDPDLDATGAADLVDVRVASGSEPAGELLTLAETGGATGTFAGSLSFSADAVPGDGRVAVQDGDVVTVSYFDACASAATACDAAGAASRGRSASAVWHESRLPSAGLAAAPDNGTAPLNVTFRPTAAPGLKPLAGYRLDFGDGSPALVGVTPPTTVAHVYASPGLHVARLQVTDAAGVQANASVALRVLLQGAVVPHPSPSSSSSGPSGSDDGATGSHDLAALAARVQLTVRRDGAANVLSWSLPDADGLQGVQVWRSNSPYVLVRTLPVGSPPFKAHALRDEGPSALPTTTYLVTLYFGTSAASGYFGNGTAPDPALYASHGATAAPRPAPAWIPWAVGAAALLLLAAAVAAVALVRRRRNAQEADGPTADAVSYPWDPAAGSGPSHPVQCLRCSTAFTATGPRPLLSICPSCGYRNVLP